MRAVGYIRPGLAGGVGLPDQSEARARFEQYCRDRGHELVEVVTPESAEAPETRGAPGDSAGVLSDPQFARLGGLCVDPRLRPGLLLLPDSTHLADDLDAYVDRVLWLEGLGIEVRCTSSPLADALENGLKLLRQARRTAERNSRIRDAIASKARRGEVLGRTPYGYRVGLDGLLEPVESEAPVVREIFALYAGGPAGNSEALGLRRISAKLNARGVRTRGGQAWTTVSLAGVLKNPVYTGYYKRRNVRIPGNHPAIVERDLFDRAQQVMADRRPRRRGRTREDYLLAGLVECASCGRTMHGLLRERKWKRKDGAEARRAYRYYECPARPQSGDSRGAHASWRAEALERAVFEWVGVIAGGGASVDATGSDAGTAVGVTVPGPTSGDDVEQAVRRLRTAIGRIAAGSGQIAEFTAARAQLRKTRSVGGAGALARMTLREALNAAQSTDRDLARRAITALVARVSAGADEIDVRLRLEAPPA